MTVKNLASFALATVLAASSPVRAGESSFTDTVCEKATPIGRHLNELVEKNNVLTVELMSSANAFRDVYEDCVSGYDRDSTSSTGHGGEQYGSSNGAIIGRLFSRLALARALQRVAQYDAYDKNFDAARTALSEASKRLDEMEVIAPFAQSHPGSSERNLVTRAREFRAMLESSVKNLVQQAAAVPVGAATPSPLPSK